MYAQGFSEQDVTFRNDMVSLRSEEKRKEMDKLVLMWKVVVERYIKIWYIEVRDELKWLGIRRMWRF